MSQPLRIDSGRLREVIVEVLDWKLPGYSSPPLPSSERLADAILAALGQIEEAPDGA